MLGILRILALADRDELDRNQDRALVEQLEHRVLRVGAGPAPGHRRGRVIDRLAVDGHRLAVRFHLELLEIERQQPKPLVVSEHGAVWQPSVST